MEQQHINDQPGPELDAKIAVKLFGWFWKDGKLWSPGHEDWTEEQISRWSGSKPDPYSTEWDCMRLVVDEMQRRGFEYRFGSYETVSFTWKHWAKFNDDIREYETITADSLPHAVCMAALSALEGQEDET